MLAFDHLSVTSVIAVCLSVVHPCQFAYSSGARSGPCTAARAAGVGWWVGQYETQGA